MIPSQAVCANRRVAVLMCLALSLYATSTWLLNVTAYPSFDGLFPLARDIATVFGGVVPLALIPVAMRRPRVLLDPHVAVLLVACAAIGSAGMFVGAHLASPAVVTLFACLRSLGGVMSMVWLVLSLSALSARSRILVLIGGYVLKYGWMACLWAVPVEAKCVALVVFSCVSMAIMAWCASSVSRRISAAGAPESLSATNPLSFVPFTSRLFAAVLLCCAALGFAITYGSQNSYPQSTIFAVLAVAAVAAWVVMTRSLSVDVLFTWVFSFIMAGLLLALVDANGTLADSLANTLLQAGSDVTTVVIVYMAASLATRNLSGIVPVVLGINVASAFGTELGAASGHLENFLMAAAPELAALFVAAIAFVYALLSHNLARTFSFDATIEAVRPAEEVPQVEEADARVPDIERRCDELACAAGLTPRETEVLGLLARGRNAAYIQEKLTISRNTVKSYVARVYGKLEVHSHQELLDLVEGE